MTTQQEAVRQSALDALEKLGGKTFKTNDGIKFEGNMLVLPVGTSVDENIEFLQRYKEELRAEVQFARRYKYRPWDVAYNAHHALQHHFGSVSQRGTFLSPPKLIDIPISTTEVVQVPWGKFQIPHLPNVTFMFGSDIDPELGVIGVITGMGPKQDQFKIQGVFNLVEEQLRRGSIYKGKAIDGAGLPNFIDVESLDTDKIVYSEQVQKELEANVFSLLRHKRETIAEGLPLKRAILFEGAFGVGKTLALKWTGKEAVSADEPWTFILVRPGRDDIDEAMRTAAIYAPSVIAFEDVDTVASADEESNRISRMLDLFDGMDAKGKEIMVLLTTNYVETIHKGMLRPGRLDSIITVGAPDAAGIRRLVEANMKEGRLAEDIDWDAVAVAFSEYLPAFVVEAAGRAVRYSLVRNNGVLNGASITTEDLVAAGNGLRAQYDLMTGAKTQGENESLTTALQHTVGLAIERKIDGRLLRVEDDGEVF